MENMSVQTNTEGAVAILTVGGRIDSATSPGLDVELTRVLNEKNKIVLELNGVEYISSAGLRAIVKALQSAQKAGGGVRLASVSEPVETILRTVGMMEMLKMYPSVEEAVAGF